jgi:glycerol-3-phosphate acyltransferase PlsX
MKDFGANDQSIALDAMGGDFGPEVIVPAAELALTQYKALYPGEGVRFLFYGDERRVLPLLRARPALAAVSEVRHTDKMIGNEDKPSDALRRGKDSSMRLAIDAVRTGEAGSVVSAGNTGALMATAKMVLKCLPGISRPAIASVLPTQKGSVVMLDLGANISCDAEILVQFAVLGSVYARVLKNIEKPTVGLLNVGEEAMKGPEEVRAAATILSSVDFPGVYSGFVEGDDITAGRVDVVVTDGFTGNIALKVAEGVGRMTGSFIKESFSSSILAQIGYLFARGALGGLKKKMDPRYYNGGMFLGLNGICVKSHGGMDEVGFARAILVAANLVREQYNSRVAYEIEQLMGQETFISAAQQLANS